jgi:hypothetical protein
MIATYTFSWSAGIVSFVCLFTVVALSCRAEWRSSNNYPAWYLRLKEQWQVFLDKNFRWWSQQMRMWDHLEAHNLSIPDNATWEVAKQQFVRTQARLRAHPNSSNVGTYSTITGQTIGLPLLPQPQFIQRLPPMPEIDYTIRERERRVEL